MTVAAAPASMLRIAVLPERYGQLFSPCASIRLYPYLDRIRRTGRADVRFLLPSELAAYKPHVIIWHRVSLKDVMAVDAVCKLATEVGARMIYDLDDNLFDLEGHDERDAYAPLIAAVRRSLLLADEIWCSTPALAGRIARERRGHIYVMPNALDPELWRLDREPMNHTRHDPSLSLLYMGTRTHDEDYAFLEQVMARLHERFPGSVELYLVGVRTQNGSRPPWLRVWEPAAYIGASYPAFVHWLIQQRGLDMGVAPLLSNPFNDCKSPIKVLDYAAIGLPTLASAMPAYQHSLEDGKSCLHAENDVEAWAERIEALIITPEVRDRVRAHARTLVAPSAFDMGLEARWNRLAV